MKSWESAEVIYIHMIEEQLLLFHLYLAHGPFLRLISFTEYLCFDPSLFKGFIHMATLETSTDQCDVLLGSFLMKFPLHQMTSHLSVASRALSTSPHAAHSPCKAKAASLVKFAPV